MKRETKSIVIECDSCGEHFVNGEGFVCYSDDPDGDLIKTEAIDGGWMEIGDKHYCDKCWHWDDDDNIVTKDGHKYNGETRKEIEL